MMSLLNGAILISYDLAILIAGIAYAVGLLFFVIGLIYLKANFKYYFKESNHGRR